MDENEFDVKVQEFHRIWEQAMEADPFGTYEKCVYKTRELVQEYGKGVCTRCRLWHVLAGSSVLGKAEHFDLDGKIERFFRDYLQKVGTQKEREE